MSFFGIIGFIAMVILLAAGILITPLGMPGTFVVFAGAAVYDLITWSSAISFQMLGILAGIAVIGEILEYIIGIKAAKKHGASRAGVIGAIAGGIIGAIVGVPVFIIGSLIGLFIGAFLGAFIVELFVKKKAGKAFEAGLGAFYGRAGAILVKSLLAVVMAIIAVKAVL